LRRRLGSRYDKTTAQPSRVLLLSIWGTESTSQQIGKFKVGPMVFLCGSDGARSQV
jgi:hypothetical protein